MDKTFEDVLAISNDLANDSGKQLIAITYYPESNTWVAAYSDSKGSSYVELGDKSSAVLLNELDAHYSYNHWFDNLMKKFYVI